MVFVVPEFVNVEKFLAYWPVYFVGSSVHDDSFGNLKEYHGTPATDQGSENDVPNPDADRSKLHKDFEEQLMGKAYKLECLS